MAVIEITNTEYTQINTSADAYLAQNLSPTNVNIIASVAQPAIDAEVEFVLKHYDVIGNSDTASILWGMTNLPSGAKVGVK